MKGGALRIDTTGDRRLLVGVGLTLLFVIMTLALPLGAAAAKGITQVDMANDRCPVSASPTTCDGGFTSTQTFRENLTIGEVVTVFFMYLYGNTSTASLSFSDSLGNVPMLVSSQCSASSPIACTATGYFRVTSSGTDDIYFTETNGTTGEMWYNAEIFSGQIGNRISAVGVSSYCATSCTGSLALGPLTNDSGTVGVIGDSAYVGFYPSTPATWQPSLYYSYYFTDSDPTGGNSIMWQGTTTASAAYSFAATTSPVPNTWAGSAELLYWEHA